MEELLSGKVPVAGRLSFDQGESGASAPSRRDIPRPTFGLPKFSPKSFRNYDEMNAWKREYLKEIAAQGGIKWKNY